MSTFDGFVTEFPDIRIDYFRKLPDKRPPLACFLSHVHSDHLKGLESFKSPFIYCSVSTRELLLRLEKFPHRMNFAKGILESRKVHYRHLKNLLKPIPLNVPTDIELSPGQVIRATLLDANHCAGAVMFFIQNGTDAILYTGDIRAEPWWVNALAREPSLIPFTTGRRQLSKIYLDTTFATKEERYRNFPSKAEGLQELLTKVTAYPKDTIFHFNAWTFGYEDVWAFLSSALGSQIHVDRYKWRLYRALATSSKVAIDSPEGPALCGFQFGNRYQPGCLTDDESVRLHTCERGLECDTLNASEAVWITPIITRVGDGGEIPEIGAGGGGGDLEPAHHIDLGDSVSALELMKLCSENILDASERAKTLSLISKAVASDVKAVSLEGFDSMEELEDMPLDKVTTLLRDIAAGRSSRCASRGGVPKNGGSVARRARSRTITFPYSRHSSYEELCGLVKIFKPLDIYPCTVDEISWDNTLSMKTLFGHLCFGNIFTHDIAMNTLLESRAALCGKKRRLDKSQDMKASNAVDDDNGPLSDSTEASVKDLRQPKIETTRASVIKRPRKTYDVKEQRTPEQSSVAIHTVTSTTTSDERRVNAIRTSFNASPCRITAISPSDEGDGPAQLFESSFSSGINCNFFPHKTKAHVSGSGRRDTINTQKYRCQWLACSCVFPVLNQLQHHVLNEHLVGTRRNGATRFDCMWTSCRSLENIGFSSEDAWGEHPNSPHHDPGQIHPCPQPDVPAHPGTELILPAVSSAHQVIHHQKQRDHISPKPGATPNQPIELSGGSDSDKGSTTDTGSVHEGDSQLSLSHSAFASQHARDPPVQLPQGRILNRKEAYKAAVGRGDLDWATYSPFPSSITEADREVELG